VVRWDCRSLGRPSYRSYLRSLCRASPNPHSFDAAAVPKKIYPKDPDAPICGCFGLTLDDIEQDVREGVVTRCRALIERAKSPEARCSIMSPAGQSCIPEVQKQYIKRRREMDAPS
jgi:NAD(P)H-nitrite reductase large subunit